MGPARQPEKEGKGVGLLVSRRRGEGRRARLCLGLVGWAGAGGEKGARGSSGPRAGEKEQAGERGAGWVCFFFSFVVKLFQKGF